MARNTYPWVKIVARLRRRPGAWQLVFPDHPFRLAARINRREHPALRLEKGRLEAKIVNGYWDQQNGKHKADIWVRYVAD